MSNETLPVGIIGAGMAGLVAAHRLTEKGRPVCLLEARERIGGRIFTVDADVATAPVELGAEFVHGTPRPTLELAESLGVRLDPVADSHAVFRNGTFRKMGDLWKRFADMTSSARSGPDLSAAEFGKRQRLDAADAELFRSLVEGFEAAPMEEISIQSIFTDAQEAAGENVQSRPSGGYGDLIRALSARIDPALLDLRLDSVIREVKWQFDGECALSVDGPGGSSVVKVKHCVVTVPVGVLQAGGGSQSLSFAPPLAASVGPLASVAMGHVVKLVLVMRETGFMDALPDADFLHFFGAAFPTVWQVRAGDTRVLTAWVGGPKAKAFEVLETRDLVDQIAAQLSEACKTPPIEIRSAVVAAYHHDFGRDPYSLGSYPYVRAGGLEAAGGLAAPVGKALFFAGDATDLQHMGTVAGAIESGARAARQILAL